MYKVLRADRCSSTQFTVEVGQKLYCGNDVYGLATDDSRLCGRDYVAVSLEPNGSSMFTIPAEDVEECAPEEGTADGN